MKANEAYDQLRSHFAETALLGSARALLGWDLRVLMPPKGVKFRAESLATLEGLLHRRITDPRVGEWLAAIEGNGFAKDPLSVEAVNVRWLRWEYDRETKIPDALVVELARVTSLAEKEWEQARANSDFARFKPWLDKVLNLTRERAQLLSRNGNLYDALLDEYEPGLTSKQVDTYFAPLRDGTVSLLKAILGSGRKPDVSMLHRNFPRAAQQSFSQSVVAAFGFDFNAGRLDPTVHPFETRIAPGDVRITTRYYEDFFNPAFFGTAHEAGHGLYEAGLPDEHYGTPAGHSTSLGVHESQSRTWENFVARSRPFWEYFFPKAQEAFESLRGVSLDTFVFAINEVKPSTIRVEADELTYNLHILLRYEIERALIAGDLKTADLPGAWNEKFKASFGFAPPNDAEGVLQDVHWSGGSLGYFPTYTLGNLYAAQFVAKARKDLGDLDGQFRRGDFAPFLAWLRKNVHTQGMRYSAPDLVEHVTGKPPSAAPLLDYLRTKFGALYGL